MNYLGIIGIWQLVILGFPLAIIALIIYLVTKNKTTKNKEQGSVIDEVDQ